MLKNSSQDDNQKYETLVALGGTYFANQQPDKALETLLAAENIKHDQTASTIFVTIAQLYIQKGDNTMGAAYYRKAIMRAKATPESADDGYIPEYESAIKSLGETP
jgi:Tfp pilus assembly protein PilF